MNNPAQSPPKLKITIRPLAYHPHTNEDRLYEYRRKLDFMSTHPDAVRPNNTID